MNVWLMKDPVYQSSEAIFTSPRFSLAREVFRIDSVTVERPVIHHPGAVAILAQPNPDQVLLVRQFRYPLKRWTLEIPAGTIDSGEEPLATAQRELSEEAGYAADHWQELIRFYPAVGVSDEEMVLYVASSLSESPGTPDVGELIGRELVALKDIPALQQQGMICDAKTIMALSFLLGGAWCMNGGSGTC